MRGIVCVRNANRSSFDKIANTRGLLLHDFMLFNGFVLVNGRAFSDNPAYFSFTGPNGFTVIDLVWVSADKL